MKTWQGRHESTAILCLEVCVCGSLNKADMHGRYVHYVMSRPFYCSVVKSDPVCLHPEELKAKEFLCCIDIARSAYTKPANGNTCRFSSQLASSLWVAFKKKQEGCMVLISAQLLCVLCWTNISCSQTGKLRGWGGDGRSMRKDWTRL